MEMQLSPSESEIMRVIWQSGGRMTVAPLLDELNGMGKQWKSNTVVTFLSRLIEKGLLAIEKKGRNNIYIALLSEAEYRKHQTRTFLKDVYGDNAKEFITALFEQEHLTLQDIDISKVMAGKSFAQQYLNNERKENIHITTEDIERELRTEIASRKASINKKRKTIIQLELEIKGDERRMNELNALLDRLTIDETTKLLGGTI